MKPGDLAQVIVYRAEARARAQGADADLDPDTDVKAAKQRKLIEGLTASLSDPVNATKLTDAAGLVDKMSTALSARIDKAVYQKSKETGAHVSVNLKHAKHVWLAKLQAM